MLATPALKLSYRSFWICIVLLNAILSLSTNVSFGEDTSDWPGFLGANRDSRSAETGIRLDWTKGKLTKRWSVDVGTGYCLGCTSKGLFFQFDAFDNQHRLICRDLQTGRKIWDFEYPYIYTDMYGFDDGPRATPLVDNGLVYIYGVTGELHCLKTDDGELVWHRNLSEEFGVVQNFFGVGSSPLIVDNRLIVMVGGSPQEFRGTTRLDQVEPNGSAVVILDKTDGKTLHQIGNDLASYTSIQKYESDGKTLGVAWLREKAIGFDIQNGKVIWEFPFRARKYESVNASTPVIDGDQIFLCESYGPGSVLLDAATNQPSVVWRDNDRRNRSLATHWNTPVLHGGFLYACHGESRSGNEIRCVEFATGKIRWKQRGYARSSMTYVDGKLIVLDEDGKLLLIKANPDQFELITSYSNADGTALKIQPPCWAAPVVSNGSLLIRGKDKIVCFDLKN